MTSGRRLVLAVAYLALAGSTVTYAANATGTPAAVKPSQELVALFRPHVARAGPSQRSTPIGRVPVTTPITGGRTVLPVLARRGQWLRVRLPGRPNGHTGWISKGATGSSLTHWHLVVDLARRRLTVYKSARPVRVLEVVVGKPSTPTPSGEFFVEESIALPADEPGAPFALALSASSNVLQEFDGGPGQIAIHGVQNAGGTPGTAVSHGCIRLDTEALRWLVSHVGPGVPVTITS